MDTEDHAYSLCSFENTDLQCDFNSPNWESLECGWSFQPSSSLIASKPFRRMERVKVTDFTDENYWISEQTLTDNYQLAGFYIGDYMLLSQWIREKGHR